MYAERLVSMEYEYAYEEIKKCFLCRNWIEDKYCIVVLDEETKYFHKGCLMKIKSLGISNGFRTRKKIIKTEGI